MRFGDGVCPLEDVAEVEVGRVDAADVGADHAVFHVSSQLEEERPARPAHGFTVRITSPLDNVFRVVVSHRKGRRERGPRLAVDAHPRELSSSADGAGWRLRSGALQLCVGRKPWSLRFADLRDQPITSSPAGALGLLEVAGRGAFMREQLALGVGELVYGLGERFQTFTRNGQSLDMWAHAGAPDAGSAAAKNVPFFLSSRGYGVLVSSPARVAFEIGTEQALRAQFVVPGEDLDYFFIFGPNPKQVLNRLGALTGRPALPPAWSFGLWLSPAPAARSSEHAVHELLEGMAARQLPVHVVHFDASWVQAHEAGGFEWDGAAFPEPEATLARLKARGVHLSATLRPSLAERSPLFEEGAALGYLVQHPNGDVWQGSVRQPGAAHVDFTNPDAVRWFQAKLRELLRMGVDGLAPELGEPPPESATYFDGAEPSGMRNYYAYLYSKAVFELLEQERGNGNASLLPRSATATCQRFGVPRGGHPGGSYEAMAATLRGALGLGLCGFGFFAQDIGGGLAGASLAMYKRWLAFGMLSSHALLQAGTDSPPWLADEETPLVLRHFAALKCRLMPYLMATALQAHTTNQPMLRAMLLEFPDDPACRTLDRQYMLGDALLVAPVFHDREVEYYLPSGNWTHLLSGESRGGGRWYGEALDFFEMPLWVRSNSLVCVGSSGSRVEYDLNRGVRVVCGRLEGRTSLEARLIDSRGDPAGVLEVYHDAQRVRVKSPTLPDFQVHLPWAAATVDVERGSLVKDDLRAPLTTRGVVVRADSGTASFRYDGAT
ncbi:MAG TPA: alpha-xylosidase [Polyangiaceae bacterium]|nr:alpha-xylosidase [Polyangiaceae bacterium]